MRWSLLLLLTLAAPAAAETDTVTVTAERLNRGALRADASRFVRTMLADTVSGQNARWFDPVCAVTLGVTDPVGALFTSRIADVARHVGLKIAAPGCDPNIAIVFTADPRGLIKTIDKRQHGAFNALPAGERRLLKSSDLPVRWWHFANAEGRDGKPFSPVPAGLGASAGGIGPEVKFNNNASGSRIDLPSRVSITGAVVIVDTGRLAGASATALTDYVAMVALARVRMKPSATPQDSIMALFSPGAPRLEGLTDTDERFVEALYDSRANVEGWRQRSEMAGRMADAALAPPPVVAQPQR
jgi:hypothetical protein